MICTVCSLRFSMTVVAWMHMKAVYTIWNWSSANGFWISQAKISWIPESGLPYMGQYVKSNDPILPCLSLTWWPNNIPSCKPRLVWLGGLICDLIHKAPLLTCSSVYTKRFYELWRCAALPSIFKSSFSSNEICILMVKWNFFFCFVSFEGSTSHILSEKHPLNPSFLHHWRVHHFYHKGICTWLVENVKAVCALRFSQVLQQQQW